MSRSILAALVLLVACGQDDRQPVAPSFGFSVSEGKIFGLNVGHTYPLTLLNTTNGVPYNGKVQWLSSDPSVATVSETGLVTGIAPGTAEILAQNATGAKDDGSTTVTVFTPLNLSNFSYSCNETGWCIIATGTLSGEPGRAVDVLDAERGVVVTSLSLDESGQFDLATLGYGSWGTQVCFSYAVTDFEVWACTDVMSVSMSWVLAVNGANAALSSISITGAPANSPISVWGTVSQYGIGPTDLNPPLFTDADGNLSTSFLINWDNTLLYPGEIVYVCPNDLGGAEWDQLELDAFQANLKTEGFAASRGCAGPFQVTL